MGRNGSSADYCRVESLYQEALDLPAERRLGFLRAACNGNRRLQRDVEILLEHYDAAGEEFLAKPVIARAETASTTALPERIGRYDIVQVLGQGGMGTVYEAQQPQPKRRVAIKVLRFDLANDHMLKRFQQEVELLGQLRHPGIAQIHEAGMGDVWYGGVRAHTQPFFAMELIRGQPLTEYAGDKHADTRTRLELFLRICDAVQHAHQNGVIHRDLKPANILVDPTGQPKILDFGVAHATGSDQQDVTRHTQVGQIVGTLAYMSPEQIAADGRRLDTRSDIYALGVVLYELLTGQLPLDCRDCALADVARIIRDKKPRALSEGNRALRGDLDTIVAKALAKDPARRYQSAGELAADIRRHLRGEMIDAKRDSALYVFRKTLFRYRWPLIALHSFMLLLGGFTIYAMTQAQRYRELASRERQASHAAIAAERSADEQRQQAEAQAERADAVKAFLQMMLVAADPTQARARDVTVREVLDDAARRIRSGALADQPDAEVEIRETIARTYNHLGLYNSATPHYEWLHGSYVRRLGESHRESLGVLGELARNYFQADDFKAAKTAFERCLELTVAEHSDNQELTLAAMDGLGSALTHMGRAAEAESLHLEALEGVEQTFGREHELVVNTTLNLGDVYLDQGRLEDAERLYLRALALAEQLHGEDAYISIKIRRQLAFFVYRQTERLEQAEELLRETLELARRGLGAEHTETNIVLNWLSRVLRARGKIDEAEQLLRDAIDEFSEIRAIEIHDTLRVVGELAIVLVARDHPGEAARVLSDGIERAVKAHGDEHRALAYWVNRYAGILAANGDYTAALAAARRLLDIRLRLFGPDHEDVAYSLQAVGWYLRCLGRYAEAVDTFRQTLELRQRLSGDAHRETIRTTVTLTHTMLRADAQAGAAAAGIMRDRYKLVRAELGDTHSHTVLAARYFGDILSYAEMHAEAIALDHATLEALTAKNGDDALETAPWRQKLAMHLLNSGKTTEAITQYRRALSIYSAHEKDKTTAALTAKQELAEALIAAGRVAEAESLAREALDALLETAVGRSVRVPWMMITLGHALTAVGELEEAESLLRECVGMWDEWPLTRVWANMLGGEARSVLGQCLIAQRRYDEAEPLLLEGCHMIRKVLAMRRTQAASARSRLVELYEAWHAAEPGKGYGRKAAEWRAKLRAVEQEPETSREREEPKPAP